MKPWSLVFLFFGTLSWAADLKVGAAKADITPPVGIPMGGYFYIRLNTGTHDPLQAKTIVLEKDGIKAAIVACDLESLRSETTQAARQIVERKTGIPADHVIISATHSHTGPEVSSLMIEHVQGTPGRIAREYWAGLPEKLAESVKEAAGRLAPARAWWGIGNEPSLVFNRRYVMKDGRVQTNPGKRNPEVVRPAGPTDPSVPVVYFDSPDSKPLATFVNYALHLDTVGGTEFSADYPCTLAKLLSEVKGLDMLTQFTIGTAGNINHWDVNNESPQVGQDEASRIGTVLAAEVLKTLGRAQPAADGPLQVRREVVKLPLQPVKPGEAEKARALVTRILASIDELEKVPYLDVVSAVRILYLDEYQGKPIEAEVQVITLGDQVAWVGLPGEVFVELGMAIKAASPFPFTSVIELAHGMIDYVPNRRAFVEGAYEVAMSRCASGGGEMLVDAATRLLTEAYRNLRKVNLKT